MSAYVLEIGKNAVVIPLRESLCYLCTCLCLTNWFQQVLF